jgi:hypothetical protein
MAYKEIAIWQMRLLHTQPYTYFFLTARYERRQRMIKISIEVKSGAARFKVASQAESIEEALEIAKRYNSGKECKVVFPIDPEGFFVGDDLGRGGVVGKIAA